MGRWKANYAGDTEGYWDPNDTGPSQIPGKSNTSGPGGTSTSRPRPAPVSSGYTPPAGATLKPGESGREADDWTLSDVTAPRAVAPPIEYASAAPQAVAYEPFDPDISGPAPTPGPAPAPVPAPPPAPPAPPAVSSNPDPNRYEEGRTYNAVPGWDTAKLNDLSHGGAKYDFMRAVQTLGIPSSQARNNLQVYVNWLAPRGYPNAKVTSDDKIDFGDGFGPVDVLTSGGHWRWGPESAETSGRGGPAAPAAPAAPGGPASFSPGGLLVPSGPRSPVVAPPAPFQEDFFSLDSLARPRSSVSSEQTGQNRYQAPPRNPAWDAFYQQLLARSQRSLDVDPNDPIIRGQTEAFTAQANRQRALQLREAAERGGAYATGAQANVSRMSGEALAAASGAYQAQQMSNEVQARRAEIAQALQGMQGILTAEEQARLQEEDYVLRLKQMQLTYDQNQKQNEFERVRLQLEGGRLGEQSAIDRWRTQIEQDRFDQLAAQQLWDNNYKTLFG